MVVKLTYYIYIQVVDKEVSVMKLIHLLQSDSPLETPVASYKAAMFSQLCGQYERHVGGIVHFSRLVPG